MTPVDQVSVEESDQEAVSTGMSRRGFFAAGGAAVAAAAFLAACGSDDDNNDDADSGGSDTTEAPADGGGDGAIAATAASLEVLAVQTYEAGLSAATAGKLGTVPPAVATFAKTALKQHQVSLDGWNSVLTAAGATAVSTPPADLKAAVDKEFAAVTDVVGLAKLALLLEQTAADTYLAVLPKLADKAAITAAGRQQTLDQEHAAILLFVLGQYPVPDVFQSTKNAYKG